MSPKLFKRGRLMVAISGLSLAFVAVTGLAAEIGPLPQLKTDLLKAELGKRLFFDKRLSGDAAISCSTCHQPENGFSHPDALSPGYPGNKHFRNSPTLINAVHKTVWNHDGRLGTNLNDVTREMLTETYIMNMDMRIMQERLKQDPVYVRMFKEAGYGEPSNGGVRNAIPEYLKTLTSRGAPFDKGKMSRSQKRGMKLFTGKAGCISCHDGANFTDNQAHNTGVAENWDVFLVPARHQAFLAYSLFIGIENIYNLKRDPGAHVQTHKADGSDKGKFITPSLRELSYTAPYMHNGMIKTLDEVVEFYNQGGGQDSNKSKLMKPLKLTKSEKEDLVDFLKSLSGEKLTGKEFVWDQPFPAEYPAIADWRNTRN